MVNNIGSPPPPITSYTESPAFQSLPPTTQDTLLRSFSTDELNALFVLNPSNAPVLTSPSTQFSNSMDDFFKTLSDAKVGLSQQFSKADFIDQVTRKKASRLAGLMASFLVDQFKALDAAIADNKAKSQATINQMQALVDRIYTQTSDQIGLIAAVNGGDANEQANTSDLEAAYATYTAALTANGITSTGGGNYNVPAGKEAIFNSLTATYRVAVTSYNTFRASIYSTLNNYNSSTDTYNTNATTNNNSLAQFINQYQLQPILTKEGITPPHQPAATTRDPSGYATNQSSAPAISNPGNYFTFPPSAFIQNIASSGAPPIPDIPPQTDINVSPLLSAVTKANYAVNVKPLADQVSANVDYWAFINALRVHNPVQDYTPDPLLNGKPILRRLAPAITNAAQPVQDNASAGGGGGQLSILSMGLSAPHINAILGKGALTQAIQNLNLKLNYDQVQDLANQLLVLSVGLLGNNRGESLLPSLGPIISLLPNLPKDSPLFSLLFATSFANRIQEGISAGLTTAALKAFIQGNPLLQNLSDAELADLTAALNVGLLLISGKLIESSLGLPGLTAQLTLPLLPSDLSSKAIAQAISDSQQASDALHSQLQDYYIAKGYQSDEADFLSRFETNLVNEDIGGPSASKVSTSELPSVSDNAAPAEQVTGDAELDAYLEANPSSSYSPVNQQVLKDSVKAGLILSEGRDFNLVKSDAIAREAIKRSFEDNEGKASTTTQFRTNLESNLRDLGVRPSVASEVANNSVIIPPKNENLIPEQLRNPSIPATSTAFQPISERDIVGIVENRIKEISPPQLGAQGIRQITEETYKTLFGDPNPDTRDIAQVKSPISLVNQVKDQLYHLDIQHSLEYSKVVLESFQATLITTTSLSAFFEKLLEPVAALIHVGIMYSQPESWAKNRFV